MLRHVTSVTPTGNGLALSAIAIKPKSTLVALAFANSNEVNLGTPILLMGSLDGYPNSVSTGIISGVNIQIKANSIRYFRINAEISRDTAGAPVFDMNGKVLGIVSSVFNGSGNNLRFVALSNFAKNVVNKLREHSNTR